LALLKKELIAQEVRGLELFSMEDFDLSALAALSKHHQSCAPRCAREN
jgi:hypothetical protein